VGRIREGKRPSLDQERVRQDVELERGRTLGEFVSITLEAAAVVVIIIYIITGSCLVCDLWHVAAGRHQTGACSAVVVIDLSNKRKTNTFVK
jgi:hypothetical protein